MKNYFCIIPYEWEKIKYENPCENPVLECSEPIHSPIFALMCNTIKSGEKIRLTVIRPDHENCHTNFNTFLSDLESLKDKMGFEYDTIVVDTPLSETIDDYLNLFEKLMDTVHDDDDIYVDMTYGTKPIPIVLYMAITYAYKFRKCFVENTIYGKTKGIDLGELYDVTALFYMNMSISVMRDSADPRGLIKSILAL